jgi:hypothetical protein
MLGNQHALARRLGVQEIIWDCRAWWSGSGGMEPYSVCYDKKGHRIHVDDTTAHRNHIHRPEPSGGPEAHELLDPSPARPRD